MYVNMSGTRLSAVRAFEGEIWNQINLKLEYDDRYQLTKEQKEELIIVKKYLERRIKEMTNAGYDYKNANLSNK